MKKLFLVLSILTFVGGLGAQGLLLQSFRQQATYSIWDDLDYAIDGTDLLEVEGGRIFTNLSNLSSSTEQLMGNYSDNMFVIGFISPVLPLGLKSAFFWGTRKNLDPDYLSLDLDGDGWNDVYGYGFLSGTWNREWDANGDGSIDFIDFRYLEEAGEDSYLESDILVNVAKDMGGGNAFAFTYQKVMDNSTWDYSDSTYEQTEDVSTGDLTYYWWDTYVGNSIFTMPSSNRFNLAFTTPFWFNPTWDLRGDLFFNLLNQEDSWVERLHYFEDYAPATPVITDTYLDSTNFNYQDNYSNNEAGLALRLRNVNPVLSWWVGGRFGMNFGSGDYDSDYSYFYEDQYMSAGNVALDNYTYSLDNTAPISVSGMNIGAFGRIEWQLSSNVRFGIGALYSSSSLTREYDEDYSYTYRYEYDDGDSDPADWDDYTDIIESGYSGTRTYENVYDVIQVPVGIEINVGKNKDWFIRFGAIATKSNYNVLEIEEVDEARRQIRTITRGDGTTTVTYSDVEYASYKENEYREYQTVDFAYGLGWKPSDNVGIDLLGMFDITGTELLSTDWFRSLKISAFILFQ